MPKARRRLTILIDKIKDNSVQLIEIIVLIICVILPLVIDVPGLFEKYLKDNYLTPDNMAPYLMIKAGKYALAVGLFIIALLNIRKHNKEVTMNRRNVYHNYSYLWYYFCAKILNIEKCNLILVPIFMQYKLVIQNIFNDYPLNENDYPVVDDEPDVIISKSNWSTNFYEINVILEDTYLIDAKQIPREKRKLPTIKISRNDGSDVGRHFSQKFIESVINEIRGLRDGIRVNVYATTNPMNTYNIAKRAFTNADRGNVAELYVYQQGSTENRLFESKGKKIY